MRINTLVQHNGGCMQPCQAMGLQKRSPVRGRPQGRRADVSLAVVLERARMRLEVSH